ncbi:putative protein OS=Tsukamurella paurometabola (strain ATCC 8368 / DSM / CCUG 35730 /CIP 100753 / JCM 10117 / KCTC 9821 / NBRC 16120 / NCIMB 702349/ NCTC 13040) OX=521096 GN=Tpau_4333 PE=4 SV=1 [Tsukamurella paurometabola]|uniref:Uncharacterized protein n=1 Tax=Tsukamurella paurometabola (strain ATCC 8368 / DSM 20162 / CCUG 35730 / CIP 100753 / JCM 10117 / KCTC 9821 / NBRC 16120 / NCIMB 702349 / NCTC 13040) TaxID=521096 RepID=D5UZ47_TSUPD|nr:hypothetical protein Tpau_4333 [Tsukamurella paurometabola DSM 20162]SUQ39260.1 Uncharacterised protein [Tsukamurella paurometabola]
MRMSLKQPHQHDAAEVAARGNYRPTVLLGEPIASTARLRAARADMQNVMSSSFGLFHAVQPSPLGRLS